MPRPAHDPPERVLLNSHDDTHAWARTWAERLPHGALLLLTGPLGAGKTTVVAALAAALGSDARVSSPTYTLIHEYPSPEGVIVHADAYRLPSPETLLELGLEEHVGRARLVAVEWGGPLAEPFPEAWRLQLDRRGEAREALLLPPGR